MSNPLLKEIDDYIGRKIQACKPFSLGDILRYFHDFDEEIVADIASERIAIFLIDGDIETFDAHGFISAGCAGEKWEG